MEKRAILAIGLSILVFLGFHYLQQKRLEQAAPEQPSMKVQSSVPEPEIPPAVPVPSVAEAVAVQPDAAPEDTVASAQTVVIEGDLYRAVIDNRGALLTSWELKGYKSSQDMVFDMIAGSHDGEEPSYPGSLIFEDSSLTTLANGEFYEISVENGPGGPNSLAPPATVVFRLKRGDLAIEKRYSFQEENYLVDLSLTCERGGKELAGRFLIGEDIGPEHEHFISSTRLEAVYHADGKPQRESGPKEG